MSFSGEVKYELCRGEFSKLCCARAEAYGVLLFAQVFSSKEVRVTTEHRGFAHRLPKLFQAAFGFGFDLKLSPRNGAGKAVFLLHRGDKLSALSDYYGFSQTDLARHLNLAVVEEDCCKAAFLRGAFLAAGSVTAPEKDYHMEFATSHYHLARELMALFLEMGFSPRQTLRKSNYVIYFKQSEGVADLLTTMGAPVSALGVMNAKVEKELRNRVNRQVNCETANLTKTVDAAQEQLLAIRALEETGRLEELPEKLLETARLRLRYPEATLTELAALHPGGIGKSGLNHRLRKLRELSREGSDTAESKEELND